MAGRAESLASDYAWWDDAHKAYESGDTEWFDTNFGESIDEAEVADVFAVLSTEGEIDYSWILGDELEIREILTPDVIESVRALATQLSDESLASAQSLILVGSHPMAIGVSRITPFLSNPGIDPNTLPPSARTVQTSSPASAFPVTLPVARTWPMSVPALTAALTPPCKAQTEPTDPAVAVTLPAT